MIQKAAEFVGRRIFFFFPQSASGTMGHPWDYAAHSIVSFAGVGILFLMLFWALKTFNVPHREVVSGTLSVGITVAIGIAKEINDKNLGRTDIGGDLTANFVGIMAAILVIFLAMKMLH